MLHFIYNPNAGINIAARKANILKKLYAVPNSKVWETTKPLEATYFTKKAIEENASRIIAVGGDGTVNEVASVLTETTIPLRNYSYWLRKWFGETLKYSTTI